MTGGNPRAVSGTSEGARQECAELLSFERSARFPVVSHASVYRTTLGHQPL